MQFHTCIGKDLHFLTTTKKLILKTLSTTQHQTILQADQVFSFGSLVCLLFPSDLIIFTCTSLFVHRHETISVREILKTKSARRLWYWKHRYELTDKNVK